MASSTRQQLDGLWTRVDGTPVRNRTTGTTGVIESENTYAGPRSVSFNGAGRYGWVYRVRWADGTLQWAFADDIIIDETEV
jgi:hypothetical protein